MLAAIAAMAWQAAGHHSVSTSTNLVATGRNSRARACSQAVACWLEPQNAAKSSVNVAHKGWRQMPCFGI